MARVTASTIVSFGTSGSAAESDAGVPPPTVDAGVARRDHSDMGDGARERAKPPEAQSPTVPPRSGVSASAHAHAREHAGEAEVAPITDAELRWLMLTGEFPARFTRGR